MEIGEYIRSKDGLIGKVEQIGNSLFWIEDGTAFSLQDKSIKHSKNIIDLIEVGDIVNGYKILEIADSIYENSKRILIYKSEKEKYERWIYIQQYNGKIHTQDDIYLILTREQFERDCYRLEE